MLLCSDDASIGNSYGFHWNGKYYSSSAGIGKSTGMVWWEWEGMKTLHFPLFHPQQS